MADQPERRRTTDNTPIGKALDALPEWARPIASLGLMFGAPAVFAGFLMWFLADQVTHDLRTGAIDHRSLAQHLEEIEDKVDEHHAYDINEAAIRERLLRAICVRLSTTEGQRAECQVE